MTKWRGGSQKNIDNLRPNYPFRAISGPSGRVERCFRLERLEGLEGVAGGYEGSRWRD